MMAVPEKQRTELRLFYGNGNLKMLHTWIVLLFFKLFVIMICG